MTPIRVTYNPKNRRLGMAVSFLMSDIVRSFPNRRFVPKTKTWEVPLVKANVNHFESIKHKYAWEFDQGAEEALANFQQLTAGPVYKPFPAELIPELMQKPPMDHQWAVLDRGWNLPGLAIFAAMGTGKTYCTIATALARWKLGQIDRLAIICPATLQRTWRKEFKKWAKGDIFDIRAHSTSDRGMAAWAQGRSDKLKILTISVEGLGISEKMFDAACAFFIGGRTMISCDESSRIKNPDAKRTERAIALAQHADWRTVLNGTPIGKNILDLYAQYSFLDDNIIGTGDYWSFKTRYAVMGGFEGKQIIGFQHVEELMKLVEPWSVEVNKSLLNLPPKVPKTVFIQPTPEQQRLFRKILTGIGDGHISVQNVLERALRMQQVIGGFEPRTDILTEETTTVPLESNPKMDALLNMIEDHNAGSKFIIWARYVPEIQAISAALRKKYGDRSVVEYYGDTSDEDRGIAEDRYCNDPTCRYVVGNPSAAGLGLTFISGENDIMAYYSGTFAYIDRAQSEDRAHRIGQKNSVVVVDFVMENSLDEAIVEAIAQKKDMDEFVKDWIARGGPAAELLSGVDSER